ncbi:MAG: MarR family transcriptional regulator [Gammaproteobacteria bacterium]|nr:MAG: MarR family transcriptional regulator [Gammaproteobacteria bacterium]
MDEPELLIDLLEHIGLLLRTERRRQSATHRLSEVHLAILDYLAHCNRFSNTPLAVSTYLGITKGTISQSIKLLESKGLIKKETDKDDRRVIHLSLTRKGSAITRSRPAANWRKALQRLDNDDLRHATQVLRQLLDQLQKENGYKTFMQCRSCRHLLANEAGAYRCGLTQQPLKPRDLGKICVEHEPGSPGAAESG